MKKVNFTSKENRIHIESDIKINLTVKNSTAGESHVFSGAYPDDDIEFSSLNENGITHIKLTKSRSLWPFSNKEWYLALDLSSSCLDELKLDLAHGNLIMKGGNVNNYICNMANGTAEMDRNFRFTNCTINGAKANVSLTAPRCFENLEINLAAGQTKLCLPVTEHIVCSQSTLLKSFTQTFGTQSDNNMTAKRIAINGAMVANSISTY